MSNKQQLEATVSWNKPRSGWVIRFWSESEGEWLEDSFYPVKDIDPDSQFGWISERVLTRLSELRYMGYEIYF